MNIIKTIDDEQLRDDIPEFRVGDTVQVHYRVTEGTRERIQIYEGTVIKKEGGGVRETFTVRRISYGVGVERLFPLHSPRIDKIAISRRGSVKRSKLFYLRTRQGKSSRTKEKKMF